MAQIVSRIPHLNRLYHMQSNPDWIVRFLDWRDNHALPLWTVAGVDGSTSSTWESLSHDGNPIRGINRRQRVQFRQAFVFARQSKPDIAALGWSVFRRTMDHGFDRDSGRFSTWVDPQLNRLDQNHNLYDLTFGILAAAALGKAGFDVSEDIDRMEQSLEMLRAPAGWFEAPDRPLPRRQNPHMHLFEAAIALYELTGNPIHRGWAQTCLDVLAERMLTRDGVLLEYFKDDLTPYAEYDQIIEPGHMAEWVFLSEMYEHTMGCSTGLPTGAIWSNVLKYRLASGFLPDRVGVTTRRLWPQTELLKAAFVQERTNPSPKLSSSIATAIMDTYLNTEVVGGWFDTFDDGGTLLSTDMPASTFYHLELVAAVVSKLGRQPISNNARHR